jgi:Kazal-type serine protease inhibitor domain
MAMKSYGIGAALAFALLTGSISTAGAAGVGEKCGTFPGGFCDAGQFCNHKPNTCALIGGEGKCVAVPAVCPMYVRPVCGCNGVTYNNDCERIKAMAQKAHNGRCK